MPTLSLSLGGEIAQCFVRYIGCIWSDAMRCIWSDAVIVCTKKISWITNRCDALHMVRCCYCVYKKDQFDYNPMGCTWSDAMHMVRCDAVHIFLCCYCLYKKSQLDYQTMRCAAYGPMLLLKAL